MRACILIMHRIMHGIMHGGASGQRPVRNGVWGSKMLCTDYARLIFYYARNYARDNARRLFGRPLDFAHQMGGLVKKT